MAEANLEEDLDESHKVFASEVVRALNKLYGIPIYLVPMPDEVQYLTDGIYWGIITVSHSFRKENIKVFNTLGNGLKNENYFHECSMFIPTEKNDRFFFNFIKRVSKIYEMAVFCYTSNNNNYFETARNCISQFQDKEYFKSAGSWERLDRIGYFLSLWSKRSRPEMIKEIHSRFPVPSTTADEVVETLQGKMEKLEIDKDSRKGVASDISCPVERTSDYKSALVLLLADEIANGTELGRIEDEIKSIMRYLGSLLPRKNTKELSEDLKNQNNSRTESLNQQTSSTRPKTFSTRLKTSSTRHKTANPKSKSETPKSKTPNSETENSTSEIANARSETANTETGAVSTGNESLESMLYEKLAEEMTSSLAEKISLKAKYKELARVLEETKECFQGSSDSSKGEENKIGYSSILEEDLFLSESSNDENSERRGADEDCNENITPPGGDLHLISDKTTSEPNSDSAVPAKPTTNTDDLDHIKVLEYDLYVEAQTYNYTDFCHSNSDSDGTEPYSAVNSLADEGDSGAAQNNIPSSENDSLTMNIKSENKSETKNNNPPLSIPTGSSAAASLTAKEDSESSDETNDEEPLTSTKTTKSSSSEAAEKPNISNANNAKSQQRKTKRRKKRGRSKK